MKSYKVWIEIEAYDEETQEGETLDAPGAAVATFASYDEAWKFAEQLQTTGERLSSDVCSECGASAGEDDHADDCPYSGDCPHCGTHECCEVIGDTAAGDFVRHCSECDAEWEHYAFQVSRKPRVDFDSDKSAEYLNGPAGERLAKQLKEES